VSVVLLVEGATETALKGALKAFLDQRAAAKGHPRVALRPKDVMTLNRARLRGRIRLELRDPRVTAVVGLVDVYPNFSSAEEAKAYLREAAEDDPRFHAHAAQYDVEAWLLPYWASICDRIGVRRAPPGPRPEQVNHIHPPSWHLEMAAILRGQDLTVAADQCPEFRALLNTLLTVAELSPLLTSG